MHRRHGRWSGATGAAGRYVARKPSRRAGPDGRKPYSNSPSDFFGTQKACRSQFLRTLSSSFAVISPPLLPAARCPAPHGSPPLPYRAHLNKRGVKASWTNRPAVLFPSIRTGTTRSAPLPPGPSGGCGTDRSDCVRSAWTTGRRGHAGWPPLFPAGPRARLRARRTRPRNADR